MTEPIEIKLRQRYLHVMHGRFKSGHNDNGLHRKHKKVKIGPKKHVERQGDTHVQMVLALTGPTCGHKRFMPQPEWEKRYA